MTSTREDRVRGLLVGAAIGEALGAALEGVDSATATARIRAADAKGWRDSRTGNETLLLIASAESLLEAADSPEQLGAAFAARLARWYATPESLRHLHGPTCREAAGRLAAGAAWDTAAVPWSKGSGSILRATLCGVVFEQRPILLRAAARLLASITHGHPTAQVSAVAAAAATREALSGTPPAFWADAVARAVSGMACGELLDELARALDDDAVAGQGFTAECCLARAIAAVVRHPDEFESAVVDALGHGGDADNIGALAGALAGARHGLAAIPDRWCAILERRGAIVDLANRLAALHPDHG